MSEYLKQAHRVQTAIAMNPNKTAMEPKHMRTGIDMSKADMAGLVTLLISKGILTREEYAEAITQSAYEEAERQKAALALEMGVDPSMIQTA